MGSLPLIYEVDGAQIDAAQMVKMAADLAMAPYLPHHDTNHCAIHVATCGHVVRDLVGGQWELVCPNCPCSTCEKAKTT